MSIITVLSIALVFTIIIALMSEKKIQKQKKLLEDYRKITFRADDLIRESLKEKEMYVNQADEIGFLRQVIEELTPKKTKQKARKIVDKFISDNK